MASLYFKFYYNKLNYYKAQVSVDSCQSLNLNSCNVAKPTTKYSMLFTKCLDNLPKIVNISSNLASFDSEITITGNQ